MKDFRTLTQAKALFGEIQKIKLPYFAKNQLQRACYSVVLNLAEGDAQQSRAQRKHFFQIAYASAQELKHGLSVFPLKTSLTSETNFLCARLYNLIKAQGPQP